MAEQCPDCGIFMRRIITPEGDDWLCLHCAENPVFDALTTTREALDLDPRAETCAFAFGIADAAEDAEVNWGRTPSVIAAACLYIGSILAIEKIDQPTVADAAGVSEMAVRQQVDGQAFYRALYESTAYPDVYELNPDPHAAIDLDGFRDHLEASNTPSSVKAILSDVRQFAVWYDGEDEDEPDGSDVAAWLAHLARQGYSPSTIENRYERLQQYFNWAGLEDMRTRHPA